MGDLLKIVENDDDFQEIINEANKIVLVLPHVPLINIIKELAKFPKQVRLSSYLDTYFKNNSVEPNEEFDYETDSIHNLFPNYSKEEIKNDLNNFIADSCKNKVQYVVRGYLNKVADKNLKRTSDGTNNGEAAQKKLKIDDNADISSCIAYNSSEPNKSVPVLSALNDVLPNKSMIELITICNRYGYKCNDKVSINELNNLLEQILCEKESKCFDIEQPSTSSCGLEQVPTSSSSGLQASNSQEATSTTSNDLTENYEFKEDDFITQLGRTNISFFIFGFSFYFI